MNPEIFECVLPVPADLEQGTKVDKLPREITPEEDKEIKEKIEQLYRYYEDDKDYETGDVDIDNDSW